MDRYYTLMLIPEKGKKIRSYRVPRPLIKAGVILLALLAILASILAIDYQSILNQIYQNKHVAVENRKLKEQLNIFQLKLDALNKDLGRIEIFEKKLRIITGLDDKDSITKKKN